NFFLLMLKTKRSSKKLDHKMYEPFIIEKLIKSNDADEEPRAVKLQLLKTMKCHNVFHVSLLEPYRANNIKSRRETLPSLIIVEGEEEYKVERILKSEHRKARWGNKRWVEYLVK